MVRILSSFFLTVVPAVALSTGFGAMVYGAATGSMPSLSLILGAIAYQLLSLAGAMKVFGFDY